LVVRAGVRNSPLALRHHDSLDCWWCCARRLATAGCEQHEHR
jgi:hypothetical protein